MNMDRKAIIAIVLCAAFLLLYRPLLRRFGFEHYMAPPPRVTAVDTTATDSAAVGIASRARLGTTALERVDSAGPVLGAAAPGMPPTPVLERRFEFETPLYRAIFVDRGARLLSVEAKRYAAARGVSAEGKPKRVPRGGEVPPGDRVVLSGAPLIAVDLGSHTSLKSLENLTYAVVESTDASGQRRALTFTAHDPSGLQIRQTYRVRSDNYAMDLEVEIRGVPDAWRVTDYSLSTRSWPLVTEADTVADTRALRATSLVGANLHREHAGGLLKGPKVFEGSARWAAVQTRYFISAVAMSAGPSRGVVSSAERRPVAGQSLQERVTNTLVVGLPSESSPVHRYLLYVGPCEYFRLSALGVELQRAVDLGWSWVLPFSRALLQLLNWLYAVLHNYGLAILALATLVRVLLHPLNMMSMKSMRSMQKLQPQLEKIREKYKKDPTAMNTAVMALYKENKVNPAGGCLPMLLQMPLFIALYQVLFNAIELRQAPFVAWIDDLSAPDLLFSVTGFPIRLLPIAMLGSGLLAQYVTPTDPRQRTQMYLMNVIMLVFFYNLPSGLVLYWTIMNVLTALQQWMILRQDGQHATPVAVPAATAPAAKKRRAAGP